MATVASAPRATVTGLPARPPVRTVDAHCQTEFTWPESEKLPVMVKVAESSTQTSTSASAEAVQHAKSNHRHSQSGARLHSEERNSTKHSGGGSGRPRIQRPPSHPADQAATATSNRFAALQASQMEGVETTDTAIT